MKFNILNNYTYELNVSGLQPDTKYSVQIAALTRKGDGDRSQAIEVKTPGGVPNRPEMALKYNFFFLKQNLKLVILSKVFCHSRTRYKNIKNSNCLH